MLIDSDAAYVIDNGYAVGTRSQQPLLIQGVKTYWLPWMMTDPGLTVAAMMSASRSLTTLYPESGQFRFLALKYKNECIQIASAALRDNERCTDDFTIALALMLATEEVSLSTPAWLTMTNKS